MRAQRPIAILVLLLAGALAASASGGERSRRFFPESMPEKDLRCEMNLMRRALGVKSCAHCHESDRSAETDQKATARQMLAMTAAINSALADRAEPGATPARITCYTCHRGEEMPETKPSRPGLDVRFQEAMKAEKNKKAVLAGDQLCKTLNEKFFSSPELSKVSCWMCHRGEVLPKLTIPGGAYADFK